jgi:nucleoid-associated protein YgaU
MSNGELAKAVIAARELDASVECRFNPREYTIAKSATWSRSLVRGAETASIPEFVGTNPRVLQMELFFDGWETGAGDVPTQIDTLLSWTNPTRESIDANRPSPPVVFFQWGSRVLFDAFVKSATARYTMFESDGSPVRGTVDITFEEIPVLQLRQNPTSGGEPGNNTHVVAAGDSLQSVATASYGDPRLWRGIAETNNIDDPLRVASGTRLLIPQMKTAMKLSGSSRGD